VPAVHGEFHRTGTIGWLRAAVLGANDGLISTGSLVVGVAAADPGPGAIFVAVALIRRARVPKLQAEGAGL